MSGNPQAIRARLSEARASEAGPRYSADVAALLETLGRLERSPAATTIDRAMLGRIKAQARLLDQPKRLKAWAERKQLAGQLHGNHAGRGCPND